MALQGSMLDYRPPTLEEKYDPRVVQAMKARGVWPPGTRYQPGSKGAMHEDEVVQSIYEQLSREDITSENRAQRQQTASEKLQETRDYNNAVIADRQARTETMNQRAQTELMGSLQFVAADPNSTPEMKKAAVAKIASIVGVGGGGAVPAGGVAPPGAPPPTPSGARGAFTAADVGKPTGYTPPPATFTPTPSPVAAGTAAQLGGTERAYGVGGPVNSGMPQARDIPQLYGGESRIPPGAGAGYYKDGAFVGRAYNEAGEKLPIPKGATGMVGTAGMGLQYSPAGDITSPMAPATRQQITGVNPMQGYAPPRDLFTAAPPQGAPGTAAAPTPAPPPGPTAEQPWTAEQGYMHRLFSALLQRGAPPWVSKEDLEKQKQAQDVAQY